MFFAKNERKRRHPFMKLAFGAFAALGAFTVVSAAKSLVMGAADKMSECMKKICKKKDEEADEE